MNPETKKAAKTSQKKTQAKRTSVRVNSRINVAPLLLFAGGLLMGSVVGSALMFVFDPVQGRSRRARVRDKAVRTQKRATRFADRKARDLSNRIDGVKASATKLVSLTRPTDSSEIH